MRSFLDTKLFTIGQANVTVATLFIGVAVVLIAYAVSSGMQAVIRRALAAKGMELTGSVGVAVRLVHYVVLAIGIGVALQTAGIELTALFAAGAVFALGFGFAMQNIAQNFVSGIILLVERTIRPGDIIEVDGKVVRVQQMGIRATIAQTRDDEMLVIPNALLVQSTVKSYSMSGGQYRVRVEVGVAYSSDLKLVRQVLEEVAMTFEGRAENVEPTVALLRFGTSSVEYEVAITIGDAWQASNHRSGLREAIWFALRGREISMAFPQLDVHFDAPVMNTLRHFGPEQAA